MVCDSLRHLLTELLDVAATSMLSTFSSRCYFFFFSSFLSNKFVHFLSCCCFSVSANKFHSILSPWENDCVPLNAPLYSHHNIRLVFSLTNTHTQMEWILWAHYRKHAGTYRHERCTLNTLCLKVCPLDLSCS